jgi:Protein of unknown function (DUF2934)
MATKSPGTPRKSASSRKATAKQTNQVTPIRESNGAAAENGAQLDPGIQEEIRVRAYELYLERGGRDGFDQEDWSRAESEVLSRNKREKSA